MTRIILWAILVYILLRVGWRLFQSVLEGLGYRRQVGGRKHRWARAGSGMRNIRPALAGAHLRDGHQYEVLLFRKMQTGLFSEVR